MDQRFQGDAGSFAVRFSTCQIQAHYLHGGLVMKLRASSGLLALIVGISGFSPSSVTANEHLRRYLIRYESSDRQIVTRFIQDNRIRVIHRMKRHPWLSVRMTKSQAHALTAQPGIITIDEEVRRYPMLIREAPFTHAPEQEKSQKIPGSGQIVPAALIQTQVTDLVRPSEISKSICIIDSGYDLNHEDLPQALVHGSFDSGSGNWYDDETHHGTHVAGIILALDNQKGALGVLPDDNVQIHIVKVFGEPEIDENGEEVVNNWIYSGDLIQALEECQIMGANIVNMSLGGDESDHAEREAFAQAYESGMLLIAAAGNDGPEAPLSYPASYTSVVSVTAVDDNNQRAVFSQKNGYIELAAPGVGILSSIPMGTGQTAFISTELDQNPLEAQAMAGSPYAQVKAALFDCESGFELCQGAQNKLCLITRGENTFAEKALNCQDANGTGAIIINNVEGILLGTLGEAEIDIPVVGVTLEQGEQLRNLPDEIMAELNISATNYERLSGTSMATPYVSGIAALVWSYHPQCGARDVRRALKHSARDLGAWRRDQIYGYGLVQALAAKIRLDYMGCDRLQLPLIPL